LQIIPATLADVPTLNQLVNSAYRGEGAKEGWTTEADLIDGTRIDESILKGLIERPDTTVLTYRENGNLLACVELRKEEEKLYLGMLSVRPNLQGKGVGKKLLNAAEEYAHNNQCRTIYMSVISVRKELIEWYERHGYKLTGERKPFIAPDERWGIPRTALEFVMMEKAL
jgi:ribosomal protein S18 acetylase RimI-like enzyme